MKRLKKHALLLLIFSAVSIVHFNSKAVTQYDSRWYIPTTLSIVREGNVNLNEYGQVSESDYRLVRLNGNFYLKQSIGPALIALPFVFAADKGLRAAFQLFPAWKEHLKREVGRRLGYAPSDIVDYIILSSRFELSLASLMVALTAVFIYLIAKLFLNMGYSLLVTFIFSFCTSAWSTVSRGLWQHGPTMLMLAVALYLILLARDNPRLIQFAVIPLAVASFMRITNIVPFMLLSFFVLTRYRRYALLYFFWGVIIGVPLVIIYQMSHRPALLPHYISMLFFGGKQYFFTALAGNLFSPARGLFIFSPVMLFSAAGFILKTIKKQLSGLDYFLALIILLHWVSMSCITVWWAGHSFGSRYFSDMLPFFMYFLIPAIAVIPRLKGFNKAVVLSIFTICVLFSFFVHYRGANVLDTYRWNAQPNDIDYNPSRLWDWKDIQFLRGI